MAGITESAARERGGTAGGPAVCRRGSLLVLGGIAGYLLTVVSSAESVGQAVCGAIAKSLLGHDPEASALTSVVPGTVLAFVPGLAGTLTACNIAVLGSVAHLLRDAAQSGGPLYGASASLLQSIGNVLVIAVVFFPLAYCAGSRPAAWMTAAPGRSRAVTLIVAGTSTLLYGDVENHARRKAVPTYPIAPWAT